jgi:hypothetical protein
MPFHHSQMQSYLRWMVRVERSHISEVLQRLNVISADAENVLGTSLIRMLLYCGIVI